MRTVHILIFYALAAVGYATEPVPAQSYPFWNGHETIAEYASRAKLPPTKTLDLGNGVKLELVLIPAGTFTMGTPDPQPVDETGYHSKILTGQVVVAIGGGALLFLLSVVVIRAIRKRQRPQYSLAWFLAMTVVAGIVLMGGLHWRYSARALSEAKLEYEAALARYQSADDPEKPAHEVTLTRAFYIGKYEVTQEQYQQVIGKNPSRLKGRDLPVEMVSWEDAKEFCRKAEARTGEHVRLPTEAEWEYACRAGTKTTYYSGDAEAELAGAAWYHENSAYKTHPVGQKTPNAWGTYDMHGNVMECCEDWFKAGLFGGYSEVSQRDPTGPVEGRYRVLRGGDSGSDPEGCRSAVRAPCGPTERHSNNGFRVVLVVP